MLSALVLVAPLEKSSAVSLATVPHPRGISNDSLIRNSSQEESRPSLLGTWKFSLSAANHTTVNYGFRFLTVLKFKSVRPIDSVVHSAIVAS